MKRTHVNIILMVCMMLLAASAAFAGTGGQEIAGFTDKIEGALKGKLGLLLSMGIMGGAVWNKDKLGIPATIGTGVLGYSLGILVDSLVNTYSMTF